MVCGIRTVHHSAHVHFRLARIQEWRQTHSNAGVQSHVPRPTALTVGWL